MTAETDILCQKLNKSKATQNEWLERRVRDQHGLGSKPTRAVLLGLGKDTLRHIPLLGGPGKQF